MKLEVLNPSNTGHEIICDTFLVEDVTSFDSLLATINDLKNEHPESSLLVTLDDLGQAQYTSMHANISHDLDDTEGYDLSNLDPNAFEEGEYKGYLSTKSEFFIREGNFLSKAKNVDFSAACSRGINIDENELDVLKNIHCEPLKYLDSNILIKVVPVKETALSISAFPNGYFTCDLNPFENYALAKHLNNKYGYNILGLGASLICFVRETPLDIETSKLFGSDIAKLYNQENNYELIGRFASLSQKYKYLFLKYVEHLEY